MTQARRGADKQHAMPAATLLRYDTIIVAAMGYARHEPRHEAFVFECKASADRDAIRLVEEIVFRVFFSAFDGP